MRPRNTNLLLVFLGLVTTSLTFIVVIRPLFITSRPPETPQTGGFRERLQPTIIANYPLFDYIPYRTEDWQIDYLKPHVLQVILLKDSQESRQGVYDWISSKGVDPKSETIIWYHPIMETPRTISGLIPREVSVLTAEGKKCQATRLEEIAVSPPSPARKGVKIEIRTKTQPGLSISCDYCGPETENEDNDELTATYDTSGQYTHPGMHTITVEYRTPSERTQLLCQSRTYRFDYEILPADGE